MHSNLIKLFSRKTLVQFLFLFLFAAAIGQEDVNEDVNTYKVFQSASNASARFKLFFNSTNRYNQTSPFDWKKTLEEYLVDAENSSDTTAIFQYKTMQSQVMFDLGEYSKCVALANDLYQTNENMSVTEKKIILELLDKSYEKLKLYVKQSEVRKERKELGISKDIIFYDIYSNMGLPNKAMRDYIEEVSKTIDPKDYYANAVYNNNVGHYLWLDKSPPTAITKFKSAESFVNLYLGDVMLAKTENDIIKGSLLKGIIAGNIGKCYADLKNFEDAVFYLENSIEAIYKYKMGSYSSNLIENTLYLADCLLQTNELKDAKKLLDKDFKYVEAEHQLKRNRLLAAYYDKVADFSTASFYYKKNIRLSDSIASNERLITGQQLEALVQSDLENSKAMYRESKESLELKSRELDALDNEISYVYISLVFTLLGFAGLVYAYLRSIKVQRIIVQQKHIIEASLVEKDSLLKEIHHRVKNNLQMVSSLLSLQTKNTKSKAAIEALEEGKSRVKAMALIHQKLYQNDDLSVIEMQGYIESLVNSIQSVYKKGGHKININIDAEAVELDIDRAIPFGLILNELVSNSFKYGFPEDDGNGKIYIHLRKTTEEGGGYFEYSDNGVGMPSDMEERAGESMGIRLMNRLVNQLQSTLNIDKVEEGVKFWFNFK
ncbi:MULTISPECIES: sensor histidine kinase [Cellulophaga]|jgi:two-component sensor histidine kinase|uniref:histidine kinase n=1 Tax=Cellulophaga baltica 18 TaxID=1348584 RepID=A0AAU8RZ97_9FLAO|nr:MULTISPECIES: sensor histidine kinase [Cellulophaga]AIZ42539.1 histidine kinase [Cellulophaga baltica 18]KGK29656.1 histidine kinase [Cellulophaga sp. E6(2014)]MBA6315874.1 sensor histidine kinase [Cellulophaga baltica]